MKTWFITGISRGLGKALAQAALGRGDRVIGTVREGRPAIDAGRGALDVLTLDIADAAGIESAVAQAFALAGTVDVVVNNAGYGLLGPLEAISDAELSRLFEVNVFGPLRLLRSFLPRLRAQGGGHLVNITSIAGRAPMAGSVAYAAAKAAMEGLSAALAKEVGPFGIKVTAIAPGAFRTDFLSDRSVRRSVGGSAAEAYASTVGAALGQLAAHAGKQKGDPRRAAQAILQAVDATEPPLHLLLGPDALRRAREKHEVVRDEMNRWAAVSEGTDVRDDH